MKKPKGCTLMYPFSPPQNLCSELVGIRFSFGRTSCAAVFQPVVRCHGRSTQRQGLSWKCLWAQQSPKIPHFSQKIWLDARLKNLGPREKIFIMFCPKQSPSTERISAPASSFSVEWMYLEAWNCLGRLSTDSNFWIACDGHVGWQCSKTSYLERNNNTHVSWNKPGLWVSQVLHNLWTVNFQTDLQSCQTNEVTPQKHQTEMLQVCLLLHRQPRDIPWSSINGKPPVRRPRSRGSTCHRSLKDVMEIWKKYYCEGPIFSECSRLLDGSSISFSEKDQENGQSRWIL